MMRRLLAGLGGTLLVVGAAAAADMPPSRYMPPPRAPTTYVPVFMWSGPYVGVNVGYGFGTSKWTDTVTSLTTGGFDLSGTVAGGTVGYNMQLGGFVFGVEGDFDWSNIKGANSTLCATSCQTSNDWLGTGRLRVGYALDHFLPYLTGGVAVGNVKGTVAGFGSFNSTQVGWTGGGGLEYAFVSNWTVKAEYLYVDLGKANCNAGCSGADPFDVTFQTHLVRAGLNYKF